MPALCRPISNGTMLYLILHPIGLVSGMPALCRPISNGTMLYLILHPIGGVRHAGVV